MFDTLSTDLAILGQATLALLCGGAIGLERELAGKGAGLRTMMLVCFAATLFVRVSQFVVVETAPLLAGMEGALRADPIRIVEAIVVGISFVGAGAIFREPGDRTAHGLTTAATLLAVAPIGIAIAEEHYTLAVGATALVLVVLRALDWVETRFISRPDR